MFRWISDPFGNFILWLSLTMEATIIKKINSKKTRSVMEDIPPSNNAI